MAHYEIENLTIPQFNNDFDMVHFHSNYRVVRMDGNEIVEVMGTFDSPNGGWNYEQAATLVGELLGANDVN